MEPKEKKELVLKRLKEGDKRSYNEIVADLELELWAERHNPFGTIKNRVRGRKPVEK